MDKLTNIVLVIFIVAASACTAMRPFETEPVQPGIESRVSTDLKQLPGPKEKVVAAVYRFNDQTGQYKPSEQVASWSTAVTQGSTSILVKAMEKSGWFIPIEREGLSNLLNERKIINSTRAQNNDRNALPPLLFAGIILEGGIIGYDTNIITGGAGVRYLGTGVSGQIRKDQVTIYLRAVSTQTGRILKTVHTTKSILSQKLDGGVFRFVDTNRLLETEAGYTFNEPPVMAVTEAIDAALKTLVVEGVDDGLWSPADNGEFASYKREFWEKEQQEKKSTKDYFGLEKDNSLRKGFHASAGFAYGSYIGNYRAPMNTPGISVQAEQFLSPSFSLKLNIMRSEIGADNVFSEPYNSADLLLSSYITPDHKLSPYAGVGIGILAYDAEPRYAESAFFPAASGEAGIDYRFSNWLGFKVGVNYRYLLKDGIDGIKLGSVHDQQWNIVTGLTFKPNF